MSAYQSGVVTRECRDAWERYRDASLRMAETGDVRGVYDAYDEFVEKFIALVKS